MWSDEKVGVENERLGVMVDELEGGGKKMDFVDQVFTRWRGGSEPASLFLLSLKKGGRSVTGVGGGDFADAKTSNWRER